MAGPWRSTSRRSTRPGTTRRPSCVRRARISFVCGPKSCPYRTSSAAGPDFWRGPHGIYALRGHGLHLQKMRLDVQGGQDTHLLNYRGEVHREATPYNRMAVLAPGQESRRFYCHCWCCVGSFSSLLPSSTVAPRPRPPSCGAAGRRCSHLALVQGQGKWPNT